MSKTEICESAWVKKFKTGKYLHKWKGYEAILIGGPYSDNIGIGEEKFSHCIGFFCGIGDVDWWIKEELDKLTKEEKEELQWICKYKTQTKDSIYVPPKSHDFVASKNFKPIPEGWWLNITPLARLDPEEWIVGVLKRGKKSWITEMSKGGFATAQDAYDWGTEFINKKINDVSN